MNGNRRVSSRRRLIAGATGTAIVGLYVLGLAVAGIAGYLRRGHVLSRSGDPMPGGWVWIYALLILGALVLLRHAFVLYRRLPPGGSGE